MARLAREALERLATPAVASRLLSEALEAAQLAAVPEDPDEFADFACGTLRIAVREALGEEASEAVLQDFDPAYAETGGLPRSGVRRRQRESLTRPAAAARVVVIAAPDPVLVARLSSAFGPDTKVAAAYDIFGLLQSTQRYPSTPLVLVLHDDMPSIHPSSLATLARVLPPTATIIQFGKSRVEPERRGEIPALRWIRLGDAPIHEVQAACLEVFEPPKVRPAGRSIVLAHADATIRTGLAARLRSAGHTVHETETGFEALDRCIDEPPDAVVAARHVPALDAHQLTGLLSTRFGKLCPEVWVLGGDPKETLPIGARGRLRDDDLEPLLARLDEL
ncbi:MAG: hypothetical protein AB7S26_29345 [Sandaracinaceae bacterium]